MIDSALNPVPLLTPHKTIWPIFTTSFFWVCLVLTVTLTFAINYGVDYAMSKDNATLAVINGSSFWFNALIQVLIVDILIFFGGFGVRDRILERKAAAVERRALCDSLFKRVFFFSMSVPEWQRRLPRFIAQSLVFPGLFTAIVCYAICWFATGCGTLPANACIVPLHEYLTYTQLWKAFIAGSLYVVNYPAWHNSEQPEILEASKLQVISPLLEGKGGVERSALDV